MRTLLLALALLATPALAQTTQPAPAQTLPADVSAYLQDVSVTIHANGSQGSGVIVTRGDTNFVFTAGHVVDGLRKTRSVVDPKTGASKTLVEFDDAKIVKEFDEGGRSKLPVEDGGSNIELTTAKPAGPPQESEFVFRIAREGGTE